MTGKDPKGMTASEMLRKAGNGYEGASGTVMKNLIDLMGLSRKIRHSECCYDLADKIDAELAEARELSLLRGAELWAKANGWPDLKEGEDFGAWLERCALKLPCDKDGEPWNIGNRVIPGNRCESTVTGYVFDGDGWFLKYRWCGIDSYAHEFATSCKRPAPEVLGADGLPLYEDDTVYGTGRQQHRYTVQVPHSINEEVGERFCVQCYDHDEGDITWCDPSMLTHTPPDTLERLRDDIAEWRADCAKPGSGWDAKTAEWAARIDAIIRRKGGAE